MLWIIPAEEAAGEFVGIREVGEVTKAITAEAIPLETALELVEAHNRSIFALLQKQK